MKTALLLLLLFACCTTKEPEPYRTYDDVWLENAMHNGDTVKGKTLYLNNPVSAYELHNGVIDSCLIYITDNNTELQVKRKICGDGSMLLRNNTIMMISKWEDIIWTQDYIDSLQAGLIH